MKYRKNCIAALPMRPLVCWRPFATITQSLTHKRTLINIIPKEKTLHSNISDIISNCWLYHRENWDLRLNF